MVRRLWVPVVVVVLLAFYAARSQASTPPAGKTEDLWWCARISTNMVRCSDTLTGLPWRLRNTAKPIPKREIDRAIRLQREWERSREREL